MFKRFAFILLTPTLYALPIGPTPMNGEVSLSQQNERLTITASDQSLIHWKDFSLEPQETLQFIQPHSKATVINQVMDAIPSRLMGRMEANGQVILINPNGVLVGKDAVIDTGSFIASTLDLQNKIGEDLTFAGSSDKSVVNLGKIRGADGDVLLIGYEVENSGTIEANNGMAGVIATKHEVMIKPVGSERLFIRPKDLESIDADNPYAMAFAIADGSMSSKNDDGTGGQVYVMGENIWLKDGSRIDVSNPQGEGQVLIGGDYQGKNPDLQNAKYVVFEKEAEITASATEKGTGGRVILWADEGTFMLGNIMARGGPQGGDGGFVEVSSPGTLGYYGLADLRAEAGAAGTLLLDPTEITIGVGTTFVALGNCTPFPFPFPASTYASSALVGTLDVAVLNVQLGVANTMVTTCDGSCGPFGGTGDITVTGQVVWFAATSLTLKAAGNITINNLIENFGAIGAAGDIILIAPTGNTITITNNAGSNFFDTFVGSQNGRTFIGDPALPRVCGSGTEVCGGGNGFRSRPDVVLITAGSNAVLGNDLTLAFIFTGTVGATGPIDVTCNNLTLSSVGALNAMIGHGTDQNTPMSANAPITVDASGDINLLLGVNAGNAYTHIGHGTYNSLGIMPATTLDLRGDICITARGNIILDTVMGALAPLNTPLGVRIGHGSTILGQPANGVVEEHGNISVTSLTGSILINSPIIKAVDTIYQIGHFTAQDQTLLNFTGDIFVSAAMDLRGNLNAAGGLGGFIHIGHCENNFNFLAVDSAIGDILVSVGQDLTMNISPGSGGRWAIGNAGTILAGITSVAVGGNLIADEAGVGFISIGHISPVAVPAASTYVAAGGALPLGGITLMGTVFVRAPGDVNVAALGNILATLGVGSFISTKNPSGFTRMCAGGQILGMGFLFGDDGTGLGNASIDFQAGRSLTMVNNFTTVNGSAFLSTSTTFMPGQLWTASINTHPGCPAPLSLVDLRLLTVCGAVVVPLQNVPPIPPGFLCCPGCPLTGFIALASPFVVPQPCCNGSIAQTGITITTTNGPITLFSPNPSLPVGTCFTNCCPCGDLTLGPAGITVLTTSGNITVGNFQNITIDQPITTLGNIRIEACGNLFQTGPLLISTVGGAGTIDLHASGNLTLFGTTSSTAGAICLSALGNTTLGNVISGTGVITVGAFTGNIDISAGSTVRTDATILMSAGRDIIMGVGSSIRSNFSGVTLIADNQFPNPPLIGPGRLVMAANTTIDSDAGTGLCIFTALQSQNLIDSSARFNGSPFFPSPDLFTDTLQEVWCTYPPVSCNPQFGQSALACGVFRSCSLGTPFTIYYKNCLPNCPQCDCNASCAPMEFLVNLHPYNEYPGWMVRFWLDARKFDDGEESYYVWNPTPYMIRRRHLNFFNHPKTWTVLAEDMHPKPTAE